MSYTFNNCLNYNCDDLPDYDQTLDNCGAKGRLGGASVLYLIECDATINDPGSQTDLDTAVTNGDAYLIDNVKIGFGQPSPIEVDSTTSCGTKQVANYNREFSLEDYKVTAGNTEFWSTAKKRVYGGAVLVECTTDGLDAVVTFINAQITIESYRDFPNTNEQLQKYVVTGKWKSYDDPLQITYTP